MSMLNLPSVSNFAAFMLQSYTFFCLLDAQQGRKTTVLNKNNDTGLRGFAAKRRNYKPCIVIAKKELLGITHRKRLELCGLKRKWFAISSQIPNNSTKLLKGKFSNS
ncbi:MAG: hypothetical protein K6G32_14585 [Prevotella sp.]|nr:hypothetical protein [Prevotella sp.]